MKYLPELPVTISVGGPLEQMEVSPLPVFSEAANIFLADLSRRLLNSPDARRYPDIATFAYWCRGSNIKRLGQAYAGGLRRIGRGLALHIAPANVPVNFAFSLAFGLLAGNANIVRIPDSEHPQGDVLCSALAALFDMPQHAAVAARNRLIRYSRNDQITGALSSVCQVRILWGGDRTVQHLRQLPIPPRCVEITFPDRYSLCLISAEAILNASDSQLHQLAVGFYNDSFLLDQNACSSPHFVFWQGSLEAVEAAMSRFWQVVEAVVRSKFLLLPIQAVDKFTHLARTAINLPEATSCIRHGNWIYRLRLETLQKDLPQYRGRDGFFLEYVAEDFLALTDIVDDRYQTLTYFGLDAGELADKVINQGFKGIDRIVPIGEALNLGIVWDGYDLIGAMSRVIMTN